jgi:hypothetical protein
MKYEIEKAIEVLSRTPLVLQALLTGLSNDWTHNNEGPATWSPFEVVGHLIVNEETNFLTRAHVILSDLEPKVLNTISMTEHLERFNDISIVKLLQMFSDLRKQNVVILQSLSISNKDLTKTAIHPKVGTVQLSNILSTWVTHDLIHIGQISRVMAKQYKKEVGPFIEFLPRLQ